MGTTPHLIFGISREGRALIRPALVEDLTSIVGEANVLTGEASEPYRYDALGPGRFERRDPPEIVVARPGSTRDVSQIVQLAVEREVPIVPRGGSGLMGGAVPVRESIVLDMERMAEVIEVRPLDQTVRVQAGCVLGELNRTLAPHGLFCGHDPWTVNVATVGGTISTDSLGYLGARYGSMGDQVLQLTVVLPDGSVLETGAIAKASAGPDLRRLFIAGEGCFGVITEALLRVFPIPEERLFRAFGFDTFEAGIAAVLAMRNVRLVPSVMDYGESFAWDEGGDDEPPCLITGFEGFREEARAAEARAIEICTSHGGRETGRSVAEEYWEHRHDIGDSFAQRRKVSPRRDTQIGPGGFDYAHVTVPASGLVAYRARCLEILEREELHPVELGSWCHPELFSVYAAYRDANGRERMSRAIDEMLGLAQDSGGSMEYCHGVGLRLAHLVPRERRHGLDTLRSIKRALDPANIMNPRKLGL